VASLIEKNVNLIKQKKIKLTSAQSITYIRAKHRLHPRKVMLSPAQSFESLFLTLNFTPHLFLVFGIKKATCRYFFLFLFVGNKKVSTFAANF
jgi:hypothetical protein